VNCDEVDAETGGAGADGAGADTAALLNHCK